MSNDLKGRCKMVLLGFDEGKPYPENQNYPHLLDYIEDESDLFIVKVGEETEHFWKANEFFYQNDVVEFTV